MSRRPRPNHSPGFKAKIAIAAVRGEAALVELGAALDSRFIHPV